MHILHVQSFWSLFPFFISHLGAQAGAGESAECGCENGLRHSPRPLAHTPWIGDAERQGTLEDNPVTQRLQDDINTDAGLLTDTVTGRLWYK